MNPLSAFVLMSAALVIPGNGSVLRGFAAADGASVTDSVADFSAIPASGQETEWGYSLRADNGAVIENRRWEWRQYSVSGDTVSHTHTESSRERSDFAVILSHGCDSAAFSASGRREMAFVFADSGAVTVRHRDCARLILAEGDTVTDCRMRVQSRRYIRTRTTPTHIKAHVTERERVWHHPGFLAPLAVAVERTVHTEGREPVTDSYLCVFPRSLNEEVNAPAEVPSAMAPLSRSLPSVSAPAAPGQSPASDVPELRFDESAATVEAFAEGEFTLSVCDIQGRVHLSLRGDGHTSAPLGHLPRGEYIVTIIVGSRAPVSHTISLRP